MPSMVRHAIGRVRKSVKQLSDRMRRDQRDLARELQERAQRQAIPRRDDGPPPHID